MSPINRQFSNLGLLVRLKIGSLSGVFVADHFKMLIPFALTPMQGESKNKQELVLHTDSEFCLSVLYRMMIQTAQTLTWRRRWMQKKEAWESVITVAT